MKTKQLINKYDQSKIYYYYQLAKKPIGVIQIIHGSIEHFKRYKTFVDYLTSNNISVYGMDLRGHGRTGKESTFGYFGNNGAIRVLEDVHILNNIIKKEYPTLKPYILGHSMGSFIARSYITKYNDINGLIAIGTNHKDKLTIKMLTNISKLFNPYKSSGLINTISYNGFNKRFANEGTHAWLSKNKEVWSSYKNDPLNKFKMTNNGFNTMGKWMSMFVNNSNYKTVNKDLPILLLNGKDDPVSNYGKDVIKALKFYKQIGFKNIKHIPYKDMRHEVLNEINKTIVFNDIVNFIKNYK